MAILAAVAVPHPPIILPEVGCGEERKISGTSDAYKKIMSQAAAFEPDTIVIISPHAPIYADYFHISPGTGAEGDMGTFRAAEVSFQINYDEEFVRTLASLCQKAGIPAGTLGAKENRLDHGTMIPLYFLQQAAELKNIKFVRIGFSGMSAQMHYVFGEAIAKTAAMLNRKTLLIASGDLSHKLKEDGPYGFAPEGPVFDKIAVEALNSGDYLRLLLIPPELAEAAAECGLRSYWIMAGALDRKDVKTKCLSYEATFGVGYGVAWAEVTGTNEKRNLGEEYEKFCQLEMEKIRANEDEYTRLARKSLECFLTKGKKLALPTDLTADLTQRRAGVFVSLKKDGKLRGCIGTFLPTCDSIAQEIIDNAISAGECDPRFSPVTKDELPYLVYDVDVLTEPEEISSFDELDVKRYGVIVCSGKKRGLLLPDLAGVDTVEKQISIAKRKGNIKEDDKVQLYRFEVVRHT